MFKYYLVDVMVIECYLNTRIIISNPWSCGQFYSCELAFITPVSVERRGVSKIA
jgi:hypothetical protein